MNIPLKTFFKTKLATLQTAWEIYSGRGGGAIETIAGWLPVAGLTAGLGLWIIALLLLTVLPATLAGIAAAVLLPALLWWATGARGLRGVIDSIEENLVSASERRYTPYWNLLTVMGLVVIKAAGIGWLVSNGHLLWIALPPVFSAAVFADQHIHTTATDNEDKQTTHWLSAAVIALIIGHACGGIIAGALALIAAWLLIPFMSGWLTGNQKLNISAPEPVMQELTELAVLLIGILML